MASSTRHPLAQRTYAPSALTTLPTTDNVEPLRVVRLRRARDACDAHRRNATDFSASAQSAAEARMRRGVTAPPMTFLCRCKFGFARKGMGAELRAHVAKSCGG